MHRRLLIGSLAALALMLVTGVAAHAECGPGPLVIKSKSALMQSFAVSTNTTFFATYTGAITLGTSGCSSSGIVQMRRDAEAFVVTNADELQRDLARGHGPYLASMVTLVGCPVDATADFARAAQASFAGMTAEPELAPAAWLDQLGTGLTREPALAGSCLLFS